MGDIRTRLSDGFPSQPKERRKQLVELLGEGQLTETSLIAISQALAMLNARTPPAASIPSRASRLMRSLPYMNHRKA